MPGSGFTLTDAFVQIDGTDLSSQVQAVTLNVNVELPDSTTMGATSRERINGLLEWSVDVTFKQNFAAGSVDAIISDLVGSSAIPITVRPDASTAVGATNPNYTGQVILETYQPIQGSVGDLATTTVTFRSAGPLSRNIA